MSDPPASPAGPAPASLRDAVRAMVSLVPDLRLLEPGGELEVVGPFTQVSRLRITVPEDVLLLQSLGIDTSDGDDGAGGDAAVVAAASVSVSGWHRPTRDRFSWPVLLDHDHPTGTVLHTGDERPSWFEVCFERPVTIRRLRLRNVASHHAARAAGLSIELTGADGQPVACYRLTDQALRLPELVRQWSSARRDDQGWPAEESELVAVASLVVAADYDEARRALAALKATPEQLRLFAAAVDAEVLTARQLQWVSHGAQRVFRFWSRRQKLVYLGQALELVSRLQQVVPLACLGFGSVLGAVRGGDLIPHDDDIDLVVGLEPHQADSISAGLDHVAALVQPWGYQATGGHFAHLKVAKGNGKPVDVFVAVFSGDTISWYPAAPGTLTRALLLPLSEGSLLGELVPLPHNPFVYLERIYGPTWRTPSVEFRHPKKKARYRRLR